MGAVKALIGVGVVLGAVWAYSKYWSLVHGADGDRQE